MDEWIWRLEKDVKRQPLTARLRFGPFSATLDPRRPHDGLGEIQFGADSLEGDRLLAIAAERLATDDQTLAAEAHVRGSRLMAAYEETPDRPLRVEASWCVLRPRSSERFLLGVELVISVETHQLDYRPELSARSRLAAVETWRLLDAASGDYQSLPRSPDQVSTLQPADGSCCLLFRLPGIELSYAEMVHPTDFRRAELTHSGEGGETVDVRHPLFCDRLEKGVLLRARVRGLFLPREDDARAVATCYAAFAAALNPATWT